MKDPAQRLGFVEDTSTALEWFIPRANGPWPTPPSAGPARQSVARPETQTSDGTHWHLLQLRREDATPSPCTPPSIVASQRQQQQPQQPQHRLAVESARSACSRGGGLIGLDHDHVPHNTRPVSSSSSSSFRSNDVSCRRNWNWPPRQGLGLRPGTLRQEKRREKALRASLALGLLGCSERQGGNLKGTNASSFCCWWEGGLRQTCGCWCQYPVSQDGPCTVPLQGNLDPTACNSPIAKPCALWAEVVADGVWWLGMTVGDQWQHPSIFGSPRSFPGLPGGMGREREWGMLGRR